MQYSEIGEAMSIHITGCGSYLPKKIISSETLEQNFNLEKNWILQRTGIEFRHELGDENYVDSCAISAKNAIRKANIEEQDIELIILATTTPHQLMPSTAVLVQHALGIKECMSFDIQAACSGFIYALIIAESFMRANNLTYALVLGCDVFSEVIDKEDPVTSVLFGDGFGAVVLKNDISYLTKGIFYTSHGTDTSGIDHLHIPWGVGQGFKKLDSIAPYVQMNGKEVFKSAVQRFTDEISKAFDEVNLLGRDVSCIITHQANIRIMSSICQNLGISLDKCEVTLRNHGNTSAASIPLALDNLTEKRGLKEGNIILLTAFGAGYTWGTVLFELAKTL